jgi:hypothetical protein
MVCVASPRGQGSVALIVVFATVLACSGLRSDQTHEPPAPSFNYITDEQLGSAMWQLAAGIESLDELFTTRTPIRQDQREDVIAILDEMIMAADELGPNGIATNHERITYNLARFREMLEIARDSASMNPPRYFLVGNLSGTCLACHDGP